MKSLRLFLLLISMSFLQAQGPLLQENDIQSIMNDIFRQHIDKKEVSLAIFWHAVNTYLEDADPDRVYLLASEVDQITGSSHEAMSAEFLKFKSQDYSYFSEINGMIQKGYRRAQAERKKNYPRYVAWVDEVLDGKRAENFDNDSWPLTLEQISERDEGLFKLFVEKWIHRFGRARAQIQKGELVRQYDQELTEKEDRYLYLNIKGQPLSEKEAHNLFTLHVLKALASSLDSHTKIFDPGEAEEMRNRLEGEAKGGGEEIKVTSEKFGNGIIASIKLDAFYQNDKGVSSEEDVKQALDKLESENLRGLILDLRDNRGGFLTQAVKVAGLFITDGVIVISKYSSGEEKIYRDTDGKAYYKGPLIILVSKLTASAAEIVAQSLQDYGVALIVGDEHTYGKGTIQTQTVTDGGDASSYFKVTVGKYYTVSGKTPQIQGVQADIVVPGPLSFVQVGEVFLKDTLPSDQIAPEYNDTLSDVDPELKPWYMKYYLPNLQPRENEWVHFRDKLKAASGYRLQHNVDYQAFLKQEPSAFQPGDDLQQKEAFNILKDMIYLESKENRANYEKSIEIK